MDPNPSNLAKNPKDPIFDQGPPVAHFQPWPLVTPRGHHLSSNSLFPSTQGEEFPFLPAPCTQGCRSGAYMVLYIIMLHFPQQSNSDILRTQFHDYKSRSQNPSPILKEDSSAHQSGNPWKLS
ncbi:hypothetical protein O181_061301 [Austropuccinia psidii MF-1]|uniref:Uncharacterized protein n=1 Tax=Austropuccinia psidii MF-1 TaxID=1389203 RepID=A0A9Q3EMI5_9BASI|nr:hypothetical protein [Austropuccinia psidii MF-1]